jgi:hypothetical protein
VGAEKRLVKKQGDATVVDNFYWQGGMINGIGYHIDEEPMPFVAVWGGGDVVLTTINLVVSV